MAFLIIEVGLTDYWNKMITIPVQFDLSNSMQLKFELQKNRKPVN